MQSLTIAAVVPLSTFFASRFAHLIPIIDYALDDAVFRANRTDEGNAMIFWI